MIKNKVIIVIMSLTVGMSFTACSKNEQEGRTVIEKDDKTITVIENTDNPQPEEELSLSKIDKHEGVRFMDWLDEYTILVTKDNEKLEKIPVEDSKAYPRNLYYYDLNNKQTEEVTFESAFQGFAFFSPDKKHIFFKKHIEATAQGYIIDSNGQNEMKVTDDNQHINIYGGRWIDNERVIYPTITGSVFIADVDGNLSEIENVDTKYIYDVFKSGDKLYYTSTERNLVVFDLVSKEKTVLMEDIMWIIPSPDNTQLALVKMKDETKSQLVLADLEGNIKRVLAEGSGISGTSWSPDQSRLAFCIISENDAENGIYISDLKTGKTSQMSVNMQYISDPIRWSPSGKKLAASEIVLVEDAYKPITYVISLK